MYSKEYLHYIKNGGKQDYVLYKLWKIFGKGKFDWKSFADFVGSKAWDQLPQMKVKIDE